MTDPGRMNGAAAVLVLLGAPWAGCAPEEEPPVALEVLEEGVEMAALDAEIYMTREGIRRMRLLADTAEFLAGGEVRLHRMEMTFFEQDGAEVSHITADGGTYQENTDDMEAVGTVVVLDRREDQRLETTRLRYVAEEDRLYGDEPFVLYKDGGRTEIRGSSFESDPEMTEVITYNSSGQSERVTAPVPAPPGVPPDSVRAADTPSAVPAGGAVPDSAAAASDSGAVAPAAGDTARSDSLAASPDSTPVPADSTGIQPDSTPVPADSTGVPPDSIRIPPDSTGAPPDTMRTLGRG